MSKIKAAIIGTGNIGTDLMLKLERSDRLELTSMIGIDSESDGVQRAKERGLHTFTDGLEDFLENNSDLAEIFFDATAAKAHKHHAKLLEDAGKQALDLTPAAIGPFVVPSVNINQYLQSSNINLITCGGQATIPMVHAVNRVSDVEYAEIVATISSKSAGPGTRENIDEFTETTAKGLEKVGGADRGKAIIVLNPAEPPILMRDTVYALVKEGQMDEEKIKQSIQEMTEVVQSYVPGYTLRTEPLFEGNRVTIFLEIEGAGDYLPKYSGNLDIMTAAAVKVAEEFADHKVQTSTSV
ncbi:acetaldehyde dehydrogenase (acetylating) [Salibacterium salarium]|uniref:Acetaldehyde dehydrogenase n=1 Tax=Salibacterium salarium TaxID=284579 RepID=A0A3R9R8B7_9BACI|nr:acetaldehyde dehydrogenase (acetylating) [Salibacterium salarium]RSL29470.1 acetaldehyde dehydrogenase (acetylating) [Salibacterium salarium]